MVAFDIPYARFMHHILESPYPITISQNHHITSPYPVDMVAKNTDMVGFGF